MSRRIDEAARRLVQGHADRHEVGFAKQRLDVDELGAERPTSVSVGIGVVGDEAHTEGRREPEHLRADIADAELSERTAGEAQFPYGRCAAPIRPRPSGSGGP